MTMTRARYVQVREQMRLIASLVREMPIEAFVATIDEAERQGPVQHPKMWAEGPDQLVADRALAATVAALQKAVGL